MTPDQSRLDRTAAAPRALAIWRLAQGLRSPLRFMMSGAHPDDECAPMLAALGLRDGLALSYACATRGEGGQNVLGPARGTDLGALRTAEMEAACDVLNMRLFWLSTTPADSITDWRFSKSGAETLAVWGARRTLARMVHILRRDRPDMLCPTFLDVPGQHGHHRAMTRIAAQAFEAAADPAFADCDLPPWSVAKLYLPAWSGAGRAYDDDQPPPPATVTVPGDGTDGFTGWSYAQIGAMSHSHHRSQGMGHWPGAARDYPLHLAQSRVGSDTAAITDNLPGSLADLGIAGFDALAAELPGLIAAPPRMATLVNDMTRLLEAASVAPAHSHRIALKRVQLARLLALSAGLVPNVAPCQTWLRPGDMTSLSPEIASNAIALPEGWQRRGAMIGPTPGARVETGYRDVYDPMQPPLPALRVTQNGTDTLWPLERPVIARAEHDLRLRAEHLLMNLRTGIRTATTQIDMRHPDGAAISAAPLPEGWRLSAAQGRVSVTIPDTAPEGRQVLALHLDGQPAMATQPIDAAHIRPTQSARPAQLSVSVVDVVVPSHPIGVIGAGLDNVATRLSDLGVQVVDLSEGALSAARLEPLSSLVIGIHALRFRPGLEAALGRVHDWVRAGGTLLTLYHRPWDNWTPTTALAPIEIGQPSLRWRVTDPSAPVTIMAPTHPVMQHPHAITPRDFDGWVKERGLYFAKSWDRAYHPLVSLSDPGEAPLSGALLSGEFGAGRHTHCALNLHHQLEHGVAGAIRLLMNLLR